MHGMVISAVKKVNKTMAIMTMIILEGGIGGEESEQDYGDNDDDNT
jgi:hypothetical protein